MALINCSECGKEISDKAASCPNCGNPIVNIESPTQKNKELLKCPKCDSTQLTSNQKGFSGGKAAAGAILTGGIGLLAGAIGSRDVIITCLKCGHKFKAGDYQKEKIKYDSQKEFMKRQANGQESYMGVVALFFILSIIGFIISFKLFSNNWSFLGFVFSVATIICIVLMIVCIYEENKRKPKE